MIQFSIDKDIPPPFQGYSSKCKYPWNAMEVGDSFLVPLGTCKSVGSITGWANSRMKPKRFVSRRVEDGQRVWRIE